MIISEGMRHFMEEVKEIEKRIDISLHVTSELSKEVIFYREEYMKEKLVIELRSDSLDKTIAQATIILIPNDMVALYDEIDERTYDCSGRLGKVIKLLFENYTEHDERRTKLLNSQDGYIAYLEQIFVDENYKNKGIASLLMENIFFLIQRGGGISVSGITMVPVPSARKFFENHGAFSLSEEVLCIYKNIFIK